MAIHMVEVKIPFKLEFDTLVLTHIRAEVIIDIIDSNTYSFIDAKSITPLDLSEPQYPIEYNLNRLKLTIIDLICDALVTYDFSEDIERYLQWYEEQKEELIAIGEWPND